MLKDYLPIFLQVIVAIGFVAAALLTSVILGRTGRRNATKDTPYECGMLPEGGQPRFSVKFYLVAMLFILFDIEIVFMYPWAVVYREFVSGSGPFFQRTGIFWSMFSFVFILTVGYVYAVMKGALDWKK
ncbi:MAG: NADH-quinone oxidoreductase subunit A [Chthoniobacteraceae bacterium]|jgi:NADH-quinone oxidoreductase subunit A